MKNHYFRIWLPVSGRWLQTVISATTFFQTSEVRSLTSLKMLSMYVFTYVGCMYVLSLSLFHSFSFIFHYFFDSKEGLCIVSLTLHHGVYIMGLMDTVVIGPIHPFPIRLKGLPMCYLLPCLIFFHEGGYCVNIWLGLIAGLSWFP